MLTRATEPQVRGADVKESAQKITQTQPDHTQPERAKPERALPDALAPAVHASPERAKLTQSLTFAMRNTEPKDADKFLNQMRERLDAATAELSKHTGPEAEKISRDVAQIKDNLDFMNQLGNQMKTAVYMQIPVPMQSGAATAELLVFRDKKAKNKGGSSSALIGLDTAYLGRFEAFVQKIGGDVSCQFRLESERVEKLVRGKLPELGELLRAHGYTVGFSFKQLDEKFTVLSKKPTTEKKAAPVVSANEQGRLSINVQA